MPEPHAPPLVTVLMPIRNAEGTLRCAIDSIRWQTEARWELLIIDDGSTDRSKRIAAEAAAEDSRIFLLDNIRQRGVAGSLNSGLSMARGQFVARMDSDDVSHPKRIDMQYNFLHAHPAVDLVGANVLAVSQCGETVGTYCSTSSPMGHTELCRQRWAGIPLAHPTWFMRTAWLQSHRYADSAWMMEDQDLLLRARAASVYARLPDILVVYEERRNLNRMLRMRGRHFLSGVTEAWRSRSLSLLFRFASSIGTRAVADVAFSLTSSPRFRNPTENLLADYDTGLMDAIKLFRSCRSSSQTTLTFAGS